MAYYDWLIFLDDFPQMAKLLLLNISLTLVFNQILFWGGKTWQNMSNF